MFIVRLKTTTTRLSLQIRPLRATINAFSTSAISFTNDKSINLNLVAMPLSIVTMNMPIEETKQNRTITDVRMSVYGMCVQNVSVLSREHNLLSFCIPLHDSPIVNATNAFRDKHRVKVAPKLVVNMLDDSQAEFAQRFADKVREPYFVYDHRNGGIQTAASSHPFSKFDLPELIHLRSTVKWREACPPVLRQCHVAYRCSILLTRRVFTYLPKSEYLPTIGLDEGEQAEGKQDGDDALVHFVVRIDGVEATKPIAGGSIPLVMHQGTSFAQKL